MDIPWFTTARVQSVLISGVVLKAKAEELSRVWGKIEWNTRDRATESACTQTFMQ